MFQQFWSESGGDELGIFRVFMNHVSYSFTMLCIESLSEIYICKKMSVEKKAEKYLIDFIKEVEWSWIAFLDSENQC